MDSSLAEAQRLKENDDQQGAIKLLLDFIATSPENAEAYYQLASCYDSLGEEAEAVVPYSKALALGLKPENEAGAYLGLGSTYRSLGRYAESLAIFQEARQKYPDAPEYKAFSAMTLYNLGRHEEAMKEMLEVIANYSSHPGILQYRNALLYYSDKLNLIF